MTLDTVYEEQGASIHSGKPRHKTIAALVEGPRVLDFGCGAGDLLLLLQAQYPEWELTGIDISPVALELAVQEGFTGRLICDGCTNGREYSTIIASQVLEHVERDGLILYDLDSALAPGGLLIVSVPNDSAVQSPDHKRTYTEESLRQLLECVGEPVLHSWGGEETRIMMLVRKDGNDGRT